MKKARIYTRTGDMGTSQLLSVGRVPKDHLRLVVYGDIDELNSVIAMAVAEGLSPSLPEELVRIQQDLFVLGSQIAVPNPDKISYPVPELHAQHTQRLEAGIDAMDAHLPPLRNFILPGGSRGSAQLHLARTVCRRCERQLQTLNNVEALPIEILSYINRLSDYLFTAARYENFKRDFADVVWQSQP